MAIARVSPGFRPVSADELNSVIDQVNAIGQALSFSRSQTITQQNVNLFNARTLVFSAAYTLTISPNLPPGFSCAIVPPASGDASFIPGSGVTLNGGSSTLTRAAADNALCILIQIAANVYVLTGA